MKKLLHISLPPLEQILSTEANIRRFVIDCKKLLPADQFNFYDRHSGYLGNIFSTLDMITSPCIYWFEASDIGTAEQLKKDLEIYRSNPERSNRNIPAANNNVGSKVIYVGKRYGGKTKKTGLTHIAGRMFIHLGYYSKPTTQGLQLVRWTQSELTLCVVELPKAAKPYLSILEKLLAIELLPLTGKHV